MKKILMVIVLIASLQTFNTAAAQDGGNFNQNIIKAAWSDATPLAVVNLFTMVSLDNSTTVGAFTGGYRYLTNNSRWALGADFVFTSFTGDDKITKKRVTENYYMLLPTAEYNYIKTRSIRLYSAVAAGAAFANYGYMGFAFQVNPVGFRVGGKNIAFFTELGMGFKGYVTAGIELSF